MGSERLRVESADEQELLDHPRQPVGLLGDDRQAWVDRGTGIGDRVRLRHRLGVRLDPRQRRLQVVADAAQEVVLDLAQRSGAGRSAPATWSNSSAFRMATPISLAIEVEERLVGALPRLRRRQARDQEQAHPIVAGPQLGADRQRDAGDPLLRFDAVGVDEQQHRGDEPEGDLGVACRTLGERVDAVAWLGASRRPRG